MYFVEMSTDIIPNVFSSVQICHFTQSNGTFYSVDLIFFFLSAFVVIQQ